MSVSVPLRRPEIAEGLIRVAAPVSSTTWQGAAYLANWLRGKGACLVPYTSPERSITTGVTESFRFWVQPRTSAIERVWIVTLRTTGASGVTAEIEAPALTGVTMGSLGVPRTLLPGRSSFVYVETLGSKSGTAAEISVSVKAIGGTVIVEGIECYEQDRPLLAQDANDMGVDIFSAAVGQPILDDDYMSLGGIVASLGVADARRPGLWHWTVGDGLGATITSATPAAILVLGIPALAAKLARAALTGVVKWKAYAKMASAGTGNIVLATSQTGLSDTMPITSTSFAWTTERSLSIDCEDMAATDGLQPGGFDDVSITIAGSGAVAMTVKSISLFVPT